MILSILSVICRRSPFSRGQPSTRSDARLILMAKNVTFILMSYQFNWPVFGHKRQLEFLQKSISQNSLAHAYVFFGPAGLGKKMSAQLMAQSILCTDEKLKPCNQCNNCKAYLAKRHNDVYELGLAGQELNMDNIREFLHKLSLRPVLGGHRLALIYGVEKINIYAANALLKTLEEPKADTIIILVTDSLSTLPATVLSRCQPIKFAPLKTDEMSECLQSFGLSTDDQETIINLSLGRPALALEMVADKLNNFKKSANFILKLMEGSDYYTLDTIDKWFDILKKQYPEYKVYELGGLTKKYLDLSEVFMRDVLWTQLGQPILNNMYLGQIKLLAQKINRTAVFNALVFLQDCKKKLRYNVSPQLAWENLFLSLK